MEHELMNIVPTSGPDATDACGCTPPAESSDSLLGASDPASEPPPTPAAEVDADAPRRPLKLVVTLTPTEGGEYRAALALGADGCDPLLRSTTVPGLTVALEGVPTLLEEAEAYWRLHPRNPTTVQTPARRTRADRRRAEYASPTTRADGPIPEEQPDAPATSDAPVQLPAEPAATPKRQTGGQMTLFG